MEHSERVEWMKREERKECLKGRKEGREKSKWPRGRLEFTTDNRTEGIRNHGICLYPYDLCRSHDLLRNWQFRAKQHNLWVSMRLFAGKSLKLKQKNWTLVKFTTYFSFPYTPYSQILMSFTGTKIILFEKVDMFTCSTLKYSFFRWQMITLQST